MKPLIILAAALLAATALAAAAQTAQTLDLVIAGGRVIDPETRLDAVRDVGVAGDRIVAVSADSLRARLRPGGVLLEAAGRVVAPGFIDLHAHGQSARANEYQVHDGVTTALELEGGHPFIARFLASRRGKALAHYGASVAHGFVRLLAMPALEGRAAALEAASLLEDPERAIDEELRAGYYQSLPEERTARLGELLDRGLREGGLGIGLPHQYYPGADRREVLRVFQFAAERQAPIFTHVRALRMDGMQEVIANAAATGAPLHIVHVNSMSLGAISEVLELIAGAQRRGLDVTTEAYPYTAGSTGIESALFDPGWQERMGISFGDLQWQDSGERLTAETFDLLREEGGTLIIHMMKEEWIEAALRAPFVMIASDGMPYAPGAHPRSAGTFSRVLGRYVRERGLLTLGDAIARMTLLPARRLEGVAPMMANKGRVQVGRDADLVVFDPATVRDTATFERGLAFADGIDHVLVAGTLVVRDGQTVPQVFPGRAIVSRFAGE